jgi:Bacterial protein of unknown function (DUF924)
VLPDRAHDADEASFQKEVAISGAVFSTNGITNRRKDSQILALKQFVTLARVVGCLIREDARDGRHFDWLNSAYSCLGRIIVLDQFPRNVSLKTRVIPG